MKERKLCIYLREICTMLDAMFGISSEINRPEKQIACLKNILKSFLHYIKLINPTVGDEGKLWSGF